MNSQRQPPFPGSSAGGQNPLQAAVGDALRRARTHLEKNELGRARQLYEGVLAMAPDNIEALHLLGLVHLRAGDAARALPLITRSIQAGLQQPWNRVNHAAALTGVGRHREALAIVEDALALDPDNASGHAVQGDILLALSRFDDALRAYDVALRLAPAMNGAWRGRGTVLRMLGRPADALISLERALTLAPDDANAHMERGHALQALQRREEALRSYEIAMAVLGKTPALLYFTGVVLTELGRAAEGLARLDEGLAQVLDDAPLLYASCVALDMLHAHDELLRRCDRLLALDSASVHAWMARGNALIGLARHREATHAYAEVLRLNPGHVDALRNRAAALRALGAFGEALGQYDLAITISGADPVLLYNRAVTLQQLGRYDEALQGHAEAAVAPANTAQQLYTRAVALQQLGEHEAALSDYGLASRRDPDHGIARRSEAFCRLVMGDFETGWRQHESRWAAGETVLSRRHADRPFWTGNEAVAGKTVLLHAEQGYGDTIQFCRYAPLLRARGATVILEVPRALATLLGSLDGVSRIVSEGDVLPPFDLQCPLMSLPLAFGTTLDAIPADVPYLSADASLREPWTHRLDAVLPHDRLRVGLAWSGNPRHNNDENRSLSFSMLAPLFSLDASFISLLPQVRERDARAIAESDVMRFEAELGDFATTAALIDALDLIVSVDTSVAHLAGALGKPVWILLPRAPDWRWLLDRDDSPWYPGARLFRQARPGDWPAVIERVRDALLNNAGGLRRR